MKININLLSSILLILVVLELTEIKRGYRKTEARKYYQRKGENTKYQIVIEFRTELNKVLKTFNLNEKPPQNNFLFPKTFSTTK